MIRYSGRNAESVYSIPESVNCIYNDAFLGCNELVELIAPCTLKSCEESWLSGIQASVTYTHEIREGEKKCACGENQIAEEEKPCTHNDCCLDYLVGSPYRLLSELLDSIFDYYFWF